MMSLSTVEARLPPGFRFHPKDEELICNYLMKWVAGCLDYSSLLIQVDLNKSEPWDIPETACIGGKEWYFYSQRDRKYATGVRTNRATVSGYWKATGKDQPVFCKGTLVGMRKTLVFYTGRAPKGRKTQWVMHEFRLEEAFVQANQDGSSNKEDWVLCRMFFKNKSETTSSLSTEPYNNIPFHQTMYYQQQVPCFSDNYSQTNPKITFSSITNNLEPVIPEPVFMDRSLFYQNSKTESVNDNQLLINGSPSIVYES